MIEIVLIFSFLRSGLTTADLNGGGSKPYDRLLLMSLDMEGKKGSIYSISMEMGTGSRKQVADLALKKISLTFACVAGWKILNL